MMNINTEPASPKQIRQDAILDVIRKGIAGTQTEIVEALKKKGIETTQASLSRDISELGLVKIQGKYNVPSAPNTGAADKQLPLRLYLKDVLMAGPNLVVLKTATGTAQQVGLALDTLHKAGVVGTIAGDDTVFSAMSSRTAAHKLTRYLSSFVGEAQ
ncbi:MAG: hypothetical protein COB53_10045 [Elusimicrobia bacterium]|nr:MAG: hypothetical protein COB53_10045 [Elusimicrobiota bacterium]